MIAPALVVVLSLVAPAAPKKVVVLVKAAGVPASWHEELRGAAEAAELRGATFVPPPAVSLDDAATALGCPAFNETCAGQIAGMSGATHALFVDVVGVASGVDITVRTVTDDGKLGGGTKKLHVDGTEPAHLDTAKALVRAAAGEKPIAMVWIDTDTPGASVTIDGEALGKTPLPKALILDPGTHRLELSQEGRAPLSVSLNLKAYGVHRETYVLGSARPDPVLQPTIGDPATPPPAAAAEEQSSAIPVIGYVATGVGGVVALVGLGLTTAWVSGYFDAMGDISKAEADGKDPSLSRCLGLCDDASGFGLGISGGARQAYLDGSFAPWIGASVATFGVGALLGATGLFLALSGGPDEASEETPDDAESDTAPASP